MKAEIIVPKSKYPQDLLAEMGERTKKCWIFLNKNCIDKMLKSIDSLEVHDKELEFYWNATEKHSERTVVFEKSHHLWREVYEISASDIAFSKKPEDPEEVLFIKMNE